MNRSETAVHVQAMYLVNLGARLRRRALGGPSFFSVEQDLVTDVTVTETYPFDTATFASAKTTREKGSAPGFNVGADVMWMLNRRFGVGGLVAVCAAHRSISTHRATGRSRSMRAGVYAGGGMRILF